MLTKVLVANRGEIARRIQRTCAALGIRTVAIHSDADADAPHVREADQAVRVGPTPASASYLDVERVLAAAVDTGCDAVHPGYGFLAEHAGFARAVQGAGLRFVGPPPSVIELMGDKAAAKRRLAGVGVPVVPGVDVDEGDEALVRAAADVGLPLLVKAVAGGGGKGMRRVDDLAQLPAAIAAARREARAAFGDDRLLLERFVARPRHVEVQVLADGHGRVLHLLDRECSVQRRHQKIVEEAPCPVGGTRLRERLTAAAVTAAAEVGYEGAGTVEFLVDGTTLDRDEPELFFLEMNTRLQVEHPVTEAITGLDLVELQFRVAAGEPLGLTQDDVRASGHAIEVRICAEDPVSHLPQTGIVRAIEVPDDVDVRFDSGIAVGERITTAYDPLLAKLIVHASDRRSACERLTQVLHDTSVRGVVTNTTLLAAVVEHPAFRSADLTTSFLGDHLATWRPDPPSDSALLQGVAALHAVTTSAPDDAGAPSGSSLWRTLGPSRPTGAGGWPVRLRAQGIDGTGIDRDGDGDGEGHGGVGAGEHHFDVRVRAGKLVARPRGAEGEIELPRPGRSDVVDTDGRQEVWVHADGATHRLLVVPPTRSADASAPTGTTAFTAPMPGSVLAVPVDVGERVAAGTALVVLEAMKMEHPIEAPTSGTIVALHVVPGETVTAGAVLVAFEPDGDGRPQSRGTPDDPIVPVAAG